MPELIDRASCFYFPFYSFWLFHQAETVAVNRFGKIITAINFRVSTGIVNENKLDTHILGSI